MPIYEYECPKCEEKFEKRRNISDSDADIECPSCGEKSPTRVFSLFGCSVPNASSYGSSCAPSGGG